MNRPLFPPFGQSRAPGLSRSHLNSAVELGCPDRCFIASDVVNPTQLTDYKMAVHKKFLAKWIAENKAVSAFSLQSLWAIREECIATLSERERR